MDKSPDAFRTISEVADLLETPAHVLRFWESRFPQIKPVKRAGGRRYYRPVDVALIAGIRRLLHDEGMTIRGVQKILREQGVRFVSGLSDASHEDLHLAAEAEFAAIVDEPFANPEPETPAEIVSLADWRAPASVTEPPAPPADLPRQPSLFDLPPFTPQKTLPADPAALSDDPAPPAADPAVPPPDPEPEHMGQPQGPEALPAVAKSATELPPPPGMAEDDSVPTTTAATESPTQDFVPSASVTTDIPPAAPDPSESASTESPVADLWIPTLIRALPAEVRATKADLLRPLSQRLQALHQQLDAARGPRRR